MTWSLLARDPKTGAFGVAVATKFFAVGALCPHGSGRLGVMSTQAWVNPLSGRRGLALLEQGCDAAHAVAALIALDDAAEARQIHLMDAEGRIAQHTGRACEDWSGHLAAENLSVAGNLLVGPDVLTATRNAYLASAALPFPERLLAAMDAGEAAGGDRRGRQSAALMVWEGEDHALINLRCDDGADPLAERRRLLAVARRDYLPRAHLMATRARPAGGVDVAALLAQHDKDAP